MFALGLMGIVAPEEFGGAGGSFFDAVLAVEAISAVDPAVGVLVDVQNTLCTRCDCALGDGGSEAALSAAACDGDGWGVRAERGEVRL